MVLVDGKADHRMLRADLNDPAQHHQQCISRTDGLKWRQ